MKIRFEKILTLSTGTTIGLVCMGELLGTASSKPPSLTQSPLANKAR